MVSGRRAEKWLFWGALLALTALVLMPPNMWYAPSGAVPAVLGRGLRVPESAKNDVAESFSAERIEEYPDLAPVALRLPSSAFSIISRSWPPTTAELQSAPMLPELEVMAPRMSEMARWAYPAGKIGAEAVEPPKEDAPKQPVRRLPVAVAFVPSHAPSRPDDIKMPEEVLYPDMVPPSSPPRITTSKSEPRADDSWRQPVALIELLQSLAASKPTAAWASETIRHIQTLGTAMNDESDRSKAILEQLAELHRQTSPLAASIRDKDRTLARKLVKAGFALERRLDVWRAMVQLDDRPGEKLATSEGVSRRLAMCLADIEALTANSPEGEAWRHYLLVDALKASADRTATDDDLLRQTANEVLTRLADARLTPHQQTFIASGPVAALRSALACWTAEPVGAAAVLGDIENYERTGLPGDARRLALDLQNLSVSASENRRQLAQRVDVHYRNANVRLAMTEELINRLIPERNIEYARVNDRVLGNPVRGESLMASEVSVRMLPDPHRVRMMLEVVGEIAAETTADAGAARFHNDSQSYYVARKPLEIDMHGIRTWPVEVGVDNHTQLRGVETPLDGIPLIGSFARGMARTQSEQSKPAATEEVRRKVAAQARRRVDEEARRRLAEFAARMQQRVFDPLCALKLDPQMIDAETTNERLTMRIRLAGEDQLGSHSPRPQAPADSLASVQIHESVLNNAIQRLLLDGQTFSLPELSEHIAARLGRPSAWEINPEHADVKITFADANAVVVRCQDGQVALTLSIAQLSKATRKWKNFQIRAFYKPEVEGRSAQLVRDGVIHLIGQRLNAGSQIALRGIFSRALSKNNPWELTPEPIVNQPKLSDTSITQFVIDDGWIGVALGPKRAVESTARRPRWEF